MICDSHCHLKHGNREKTEYSARAIVEVMDEAGIDRTVVFAMSTTSAHAIQMARDAAQAFPDRLIPYAYAIPHIAVSALEQVEEAVRDLGFRGIKIHGGETQLTEHIIDPVFNLAARLEVPCLVDFVGNVGHTRRILRAFPNTTIIIAHMGKYLCTNAGLLDSFIELAEDCENAILDTSGVTLSWKIVEAVDRIGSDRMVFGIDGPHPYPTLSAYARADRPHPRAVDFRARSGQSVVGVHCESVEDGVDTTASENREPEAWGTGQALRYFLMEVYVAEPDLKAQQRLSEAVEGLSEQKLEEVIDFAQYLRSRDEWEATQELLSDPGMRDDIAEGLKQDRKGDTLGWQEAKDASGRRFTRQAQRVYARIDEATRLRLDEVFLVVGTR